MQSRAPTPRRLPPPQCGTAKLPAGTCPAPQPLLDSVSADSRKPQFAGRARQAAAPFYMSSYVLDSTTSVTSGFPQPTTKAVLACNAGLSRFVVIYGA